mmetsp:Transcript_63488/g.147991  ORF Transcript_63488/g.147991 Transcript_63488/m.147991 type:complete len:208 (+) Transcript_63488:1237-1860(+)
MSMKSPKPVALVTLPSTSAPMEISERGVVGSSVESASSMLTSSKSPTASTLLMMRSLIVAFTLMLSGALRSNASLEAPMSMKAPVSVTLVTVPCTSAPRTSSDSGVPTVFLSLTVTRSPSTLTTIRSTTTPLLYSPGGFVSWRMGASTSPARPASKKTPYSAVLVTVPSISSPTLTSCGNFRCETSTCFLSTFTETTFSSSILSPTV